jgi:hypothetical protein
MVLKTPPPTTSTFHLSTPGSASYSSHQRFSGDAEVTVQAQPRATPGTTPSSVNGKSAADPGSSERVKVVTAVRPAQVLQLLVDWVSSSDLLILLWSQVVVRLRPALRADEHQGALDYQRQSLRLHRPEAPVPVSDFNFDQVLGPQSTQVGHQTRITFDDHATDRSLLRLHTLAA